MTLAESVRLDTCRQMHSIVSVCVAHTRLHIYRSVKHEILCGILDMAEETIRDQIEIHIDDFLDDYFMFGKRIQ
jgi:hypothetical protein